MKKSTGKKMKFGKKGAAATGGVALLALLAALFGTGKLGFGTDVGVGDPAGPTGKADSSVVETVASTRESPASTTAAGEAEAAKIEIRVQGREYNYQNVTYGNSEHPLEELLEALKEFPPDARIDLTIEENATKNAVDDLENALIAAGFTDIHK